MKRTSFGGAAQDFIAPPTTANDRDVTGEQLYQSSHLTQSRDRQQPFQIWVNACSLAVPSGTLHG